MLHHREAEHEQLAVHDLGRGALPRDLSGFEIEAFFTYSDSERYVIDDERRTPSLKLALALQIGFLRMTGRLLAQRRALVRAINAELSRTSDRQRLLQFARRWLYEHKLIIP